MKHLLSLFLFLLSMSTGAQRLIRGQVLDAERNTPVVAASVFLNNTTIGTITNDKGEFRLQLPDGKFELVISSVGYNTSAQVVSTDENKELWIIKLAVKTDQLETILVEPYEKNGWEKYGKTFTDNFVGTSAAASNCRILNPEVIRFRNSKKTGEIIATAPTAIMIENNELGYIVHYQLEKFSYNYRSGYMTYLGYPFFEPMTGNEKRKNKWEKRRESVYSGSMMHFMRSVYRNTLQQEGFEIRAVKKEKDDRSPLRHGSLVKSNYVDIISDVIAADSIAYAVNQTTAGLAFGDYLQVVYLKSSPPSEYTRMFRKDGQQMRSQITLINGRPVEIHSNGLYYNPLDILTTGYWAWSEKIANLLPYDFRSSSTK